MHRTLADSHRSSSCDDIIYHFSPAKPLPGVVAATFESEKGPEYAK